MKYKNPKLKKLLIDISSEESDELLNDCSDQDDNVNDNNNNNTENQESEEGDEYDDNKKSMYLIHNEYIDSDDPNISEFLKFCINKGLFDNTFYDMHNSFSVVATKLPQTFEKLSSNNDNENDKNICKKTFIKKFKKEYGFLGDINFIYSCLDTSEKGFITWDEFIDFFLPFVQYITV